MKSTCLLIMSVLTPAALLAAGCHAPPQPETHTVARVTVETPDEYEQLWQAATDTLQRHWFRPDRQDRREGVITTHPDTSAHWFEWWRPQPQPAYYWGEANLHTIQRQATVRIRPSDEQGTCTLDVLIDRYQYSLEERQIDNPAVALRLYSSAAPTTSGQMVKPAESSHWIHLGRDEQMECALLASILRRYGKTTVGDTTPEELTEK